MAFPALAVRTPDIGGAIAQGLNIRGAMTQNRLLEQKAQRETQLSGLRGQLMGGDGVDPNVARQMMAAGGGEEVARTVATIGAMDKSERDRTTYNIDMLGRASGNVLNAAQQSPLAAAAAYGASIAELDRAGVEHGMPPEYSPDLLPRIQAARDMSMSVGQQLKAAPAVQYGPPKFDKEVGKFYQVHPRTGKREYTSQQTGMDVTLPDGTVIQTGVKRGGMQKKTAGDIEKRLFDAQQGLARLADIQRSFKPEYQTYATRGQAWWSAIKEKAGQDVSPEDRKGLEEFSKFKRTALENINLGIKEMTGAQMSNSEAGRIRKGMPDPGEGVFGGDSPTEFKAKMDDTIRSLRAASARYTYALRNGLDPMKSGISLDGIKDVIRNRQREIVQEVRTSSPNISDEGLRSVLQQRLGIEFGLVF